MGLYTLCMPVSANWGRMLPFVPGLTSAQTLSCHAEIPTLHSSGSLRLIDGEMVNDGCSRSSC